jgi:hypothetical protein
MADKINWSRTKNSRSGNTDPAPLEDTRYSRAQGDKIYIRIPYQREPIALSACRIQVYAVNLTSELGRDISELGHNQKIGHVSDKVLRNLGAVKRFILAVRPVKDDVILLNCKVLERGTDLWTFTGETIRHSFGAGAERKKSSATKIKRTC